MTFASSSSTELVLHREQTFGAVSQLGNPVKIRVTGESLDYAINKESSKELSTIRGSSSAVSLSAGTSGGIQMEMHYRGPDMLLASTLQDNWVGFGSGGLGEATLVNVTATTITAAVPTSGSSSFSVLKPGQWFRLVSAGPNNGKILRVSKVILPTASVLTLDPNTPAAPNLAESVQIESSRLTHGTLQSSFSIERISPDIGVFTLFTGQTPSKLSLKVESSQITTLGFDFVGKSAEQTEVTSLPDPVADAATFDIHSGVLGEENAIWFNEAPTTNTYVKSISVDFDNALRAQNAVGYLESVAIGSGTISCTVNMQVYFADKSLFNSFRSNGRSSVAFRSLDDQGNGYIFTFPALNIASWKSNAGGKDNDMLVDLQCTALLDSTATDVSQQKLLFIDRLGPNYQSTTWYNYFFRPAA